MCFNLSGVGSASAIAYIHMSPKIMIWQPLSGPSIFHITAWTSWVWLGLSIPWFCFLDPLRKKERAKLRRLPRLIPSVPTRGLGALGVQITIQ